MIIKLISKYFKDSKFVSIFPLRKELMNNKIYTWFCTYSLFSHCFTNQVSDFQTPFQLLRRERNLVFIISHTWSTNTTGHWACKINYANDAIVTLNGVFNLVPRAFSSTIFKMADHREKTLAKAGSRGTKSPKILEIFVTWHFEKGLNKMAAKHRVGSKIPVKERFNFVHEAVVAS